MNNSMSESDQEVIQTVYPGEYKSINIIGRGSYAKVYKAETVSGEIVAIKVIDIKNMERDIIYYMENEIQLLSESDNKNVIKLFKSHQANDRLILVLEFCSFDVQSMMKRFFKGKLNDDLVIIILRQLANGLSYLHMNKIIHRDLKLDNFAVQLTKEDQIALESRNDLTVFERATYKLIDLGLAKKLGDVQAQTNTWAGTELNMAPEILNEQKYSFQADMYSLGVCVYCMLVGRYPYHDPTNKTPQQDLIQKENVDLKPIQNAQLSSLIKRMLKFNPKERITFGELYQHEFFKFREGDLVNPIDLELQQNQNIYSQNLVSVFEQEQQQIQQQIFLAKEVQQMSKEGYQEKINNYLLKQECEECVNTNIQNKYDNSKAQNDQIMQLYHIRNQYIAILKLADYIEEMIPIVKQTKLNFFTMESKFEMFVEYLRMVSKQLYIKLLNRFNFFSPTLGSYDRYKLLEKQVKREDKERLDGIKVRQGGSKGVFSWFSKKVLNKIQCEPNDSLAFNQQYQEINIELYKELLKMLQDTFYKYPSDDDPKIKKIKCLLYLSMIDTARSRVLFQVEQQNIDYKAEELLINRAKDEPDILSEKVTSILELYKLEYK